MIKQSKNTLKIFLFLLFSIVFCTVGFGQRKFSLPFSSSYDENAFLLLGIQYNVVSQSYQLQLKKDWQSQTIDYGNDDRTLGELKSIHSKPKIGFSVGIPVDLRANDNLYFTFNPSFLFFNGLGVEYTSMNSDLEPITRRHRHILSSNDGSNFNAFEFPLSVKFRSDEKVLKNKFNRYRGYLIAGARYTRWIGINGEYKGLQESSTQLPDALIMKPGYLSWEAGIGADIFFAYFKMSPELKFNQSFSNVFDKTHSLNSGNKFMAPIDKGLIRNIYFSLIFQ